MFSEVEQAFHSIWFSATRARIANMQKYQQNLPHEYSWESLQEKVTKGVALAQERGQQLLDRLHSWEEQDLSLDQSLELFEEMQALVMHPEVEIALTKIHEALEEAGIHGVILIPTGSGALGGMLIRELAGRYKIQGRQDVDLTMKYDPAQSDRLTVSRTNEIIYSMFASQYQADPNFPDGFKTDDHGLLVASRYNEPILPDDETLLAQLRGYRLIPGWGTTLHPIAKYFSRGFPEESLRKGRRRILHALHVLYSENPGQWKSAVESIEIACSGYGNTDIVKSKYFVGFGESDYSQEAIDWRSRAASLQEKLVKVRKQVITHLLAQTAHEDIA